MQVIIDVQNMLYALPVYRNLLLKNFQNAIDQFIHELSQYQDWSGHRLTLVFDGPSTNDYPIGAHGIEILYSGTQRTADSVIEALVSRSHSKFDVLVVTSDNAVQDLTSALGARFVSPVFFKRMMDQEGGKF